MFIKNNLLKARNTTLKIFLLLKSKVISHHIRWLPSNKINLKNNPQENIITPFKAPPFIKKGGGF